MQVSSVDIASKVRSVRDIVYETLKEAILLSNYAPGSRLNERELAAQYRVSTTPLKEALRLLEQEGLIVTKPRVGSFVSTDIMNSIEEVNLVRAALEGVAARLAAEKVSSDDITVLEETINEMKFNTIHKDAAKLIESNDHFHKLVRSFAQNNYIFKQIEAVRSYDRSFRKRALANPVEFDRAFCEHEQIFLRIKAKDPDGAETAVRDHIRRTTLYVKQSSIGQK